MLAHLTGSRTITALPPYKNQSLIQIRNQIKYIFSSYNIKILSFAIYIFEILSNQILSGNTKY